MIELTCWSGSIVSCCFQPLPCLVNEKMPLTVPTRPGLGVDLNEDVVKQHLREPGYFEPTPEYDKYILDDLRIRGPYPHLDEHGKMTTSRE